MIRKHIQKSIEIRNSMLDTITGDIEKAGKIIIETYKAKGKLLACGNGGSAADAQHIAAELLIRFKGDHIRPSLPALSLASDSSVITAAGNDFGADYIFSRQIEGLGKPEDCLLAITTSGNSPNILHALQAAKKHQLKTILLTGRTGGNLLKDHGDILDAVVCIPADETAHVQEAHIMTGHLLCSMIEKELFNLG